MRKDKPSAETPDILPRLYTVAETARYAKTSEKTVRRWIDQELLSVYRLGRQIRIAEADLVAFLRKHRQ